ncbi:MAG TPA: DUF6268 family outer membrane beta-barrel protein [Chthoniobacterales bacterium]|nr:DUF6268 family outer membrane beta-barrel protein [Chthoniobacterales bacterium]
MRPVWCALGLFCFGEIALADGNALGQPSPAPSARNLGAEWSFDLNTTYTLGGRIEKAGDFGSQAEYRYEVEALRNFRITGDYYLQLGIDYERFDFSRSNSTFPSSFTSLAGEVMFSYWSGDDFFPVIQLEPGLYYTRDHITGNSFDVPIRITPGFKLTDSLYLILGCSIDPFSNPIVFPIGGFNWKINDRFNFRAVFPRPRFSYTPNKQLEIYLGGELIGDSYRNGPTNDRRTDDAILEYEEERVGLGISYTLRKGIDFEAVAGWMFQREFDYIRAGPIYYGKGAPYFRMDLSIDLF